MKDRQKIEEFLKDLSLTVPYIQDYQMIEWMMLVFSLLSLVMLLRSRFHGLLLLTISDFCWVVYDLYSGEYAQSLLFLIYGLLTTWGCLDQYLENKRSPKSV